MPPIPVVGWPSSSMTRCRAVEAATEAIRLRGDLAEAFNNRALAYIRLGRYDLAQPDFDRTIRLHQNYGNALIARSMGPIEAGPL